MKKPDKDKIKKEIEEKRKQLSEEFGMLTSGSSEDLPPEVELQWLQNIHEFEKQAKEQKKITVYDKIDKPEVKSINDLNAKELSDEINFIMDMLLLNNLQLNILYDVNDEDLYRFITEELYPLEIDDFNIPGMTTNFIYEEFHPNHYEDLKENTLEAIEGILSQEEIYWDVKIATGDFSTDSGEKLSQEKVDKKVLAFKSSFESFTIENYEIEKVDFNLDEKRGKTEFLLHYVAKSVDTGEEMVFSGEGTFDFIYKWEQWLVNGIEMPGFGI